MRRVTLTLATLTIAATLATLAILSGSELDQSWIYAGTARAFDGHLSVMFALGNLSVIWDAATVGVVSFLAFMGASVAASLAMLSD